MSGYFPAGDIDGSDLDRRARQGEDTDILDHDERMAQFAHLDLLRAAECDDSVWARLREALRKGSQ